MKLDLRHGDCLEVLRSLPAASVDACITDPPYGETACDWDTRVPGWPAEVRRVLKPHGSLWVFGSLRMFWETADDFKGWHLAQDLVWEKQNGSGFDTDRFKRVHELIAHFYPADVKWADIYRDPQKVPGKARPSAAIRARGLTPHRGTIGSKGYEYTDERFMRSVIAVASMHREAEVETQKPDELLEPLVRYSCAEGGIVLDPFCGSGSTGVAAQRNGRGFIGIDNRTEAIDIARRRIDSDAPLITQPKRRIPAVALEQPSLFAGGGK